MIGWKEPINAKSQRQKEQIHRQNSFYIYDVFILKRHLFNSKPFSWLCRSVITCLAPLSTDLKPPPPQSRRNTLSCLKGAEPSMLLSASTPDSISIIPSSEAASQLSSPATGTARSDVSGCHGRRGMMQAIKNERRASKVRISSAAECLSGDLRCLRTCHETNLALDALLN